MIVVKRQSEMLLYPNRDETAPHWAVNTPRGEEGRLGDPKDAFAQLQARRTTLKDKEQSLWGQG